MADDLDDDWFVKEDIDVDQDSDDVTSTEGLLPSNPYTLIKNLFFVSSNFPGFF